MQAEDIGLKLRTKIYLFWFFFTTVILAFIFFTYNTYEKQYQQDLRTYITEQADFYKKQLITSYYEAFHSFEQQQKLFYAVHKRAREILKKTPEKNLQVLIKELKEEFGLKDIDLDIYLIDKNYIIYKTSYPKDLGFNLAVIPEAKEFLDKTSKDKKTYIADFVSTDAQTMEYKLYSYSYLNDNSYLELGFVDKSIYNRFKMTIEKFLKESGVELFNIIKVGNTFRYYSFAETQDESKEEFFQKIKQRASVDTDKNPIIKAYLKKEAEIEYRQNKALVFVPIFDTNMYRKIGFENVILKVEVDIGHKLAALHRFEMLFYSSLFFVFLFFLGIYLFINRYFTAPIDKIVQSINQKKVLEHTELLSRNDELSIIAKEYNKLLEALNKEIYTNKLLLEENKQFIADTVHQIRTPLTNIMMNSEMIKRNDTTQKSANFVEQINASINMLSNSYEDLSYTISYNTLEYKASRLSVSDVVLQRVKFFATISKVNFKKIEAEIEENLFYTINQIELERLIDNNISNGIKYADANKPIHIRVVKSANEIALEFRTYGAPIVNPQQIFEKNYRENESKRGLGLGLNMVKEICNKYGIIYSVEYKENQNIFLYIFKGNHSD